MPLKTDLNVTPYFDDYSAANNFQQILARPGQAIQARELTQLQSILRNQSEKLGDFLLQEGTVVIPGNLKLSQNIDTIKLAPTYGGETIDVTQYQDAVLTGTTTMSFFFSIFVPCPLIHHSHSPSSITQFSSASRW